MPSYVSGWAWDRRWQRNGKSEQGWHLTLGWQVPSNAIHREHKQIQGSWATWQNHQAASIQTSSLSFQAAGPDHPVLPTATMGKKCGPSFKGSIWVQCLATPGCQWLPAAPSLFQEESQPNGEENPAWLLEGDMLQAGTALMVCKQGTHILRVPRSPALPDSRQGCVSEAISYPTFNAGCSTVVFSSRAHKYSLGDSEKTNKQTKTVSMKENSLEAPRYVYPISLAQWCSNCGPQTQHQYLLAITPPQGSAFTILPSLEEST